MKFLLDENISQTVSRGLRDAGYDVLHVLDAGYAEKPDEDIIRFAKRADRIIITHDRDFGNVLRFPVASHAGGDTVAAPQSKPAEYAGAPVAFSPSTLRDLR